MSDLYDKVNMDTYSYLFYIICKKNCDISPYHQPFELAIYVSFYTNSNNNIKTILIDTIT
jgi:hypothetical protein